MLQPGTILDNKYQIEAVIGQGGFGYVYRARERLTGEAVAIKELVPAFVDHPEMSKRFIQEARATLRLSHPHVVRTHGIFENRGTYYLAMECLVRGSLADALKHGPPPMKEAIRIATELCEALAYAHREGVIHCDIKPANVLFDEKGRARLADFGIAHVSAEMMTRQLFTATGTAMGTVRYMAPEQLEGVRNDPRIDVYAVGAVLYEMLAGRPYLDFETESTAAAHMRNMQRIQAEQPRSLRSINPDIPPWLVVAVERALRKAPEDRFGGAKELLAALEEKGQLPPKLAPDKPEGVVSEAESLLESEPAHQDGALEEPTELATDPELPVKPPPEQDELLEARKPAQADTFEDVPLPPIVPSDEDDEGSHPGLRAIPVWGWALSGLATLVLLVYGIVWLQGRGSGPPESLATIPTAEAQPTESSPTSEPTATFTPLSPTEQAPSAVPSTEFSLGDTWTRPSDDMVMVYVPAGEFQMGSTDAEVDAALDLCNQYYDVCQRSWFEREQPMHTVLLDEFWIDRTEVTNVQYTRCVDAGDCEESEYADDSDFNGADYPVVGVDWYNAAAYCAWAGTRLPTEAEWEYAARGPERRVFPWGDTFGGTRLNFCDANCEYDWSAAEYDDGYRYTAPVGSYPDSASWCGALDMAGNVWEWMADWYGGYRSGGQVNPTGASSGSRRVMRGGSWYDNAGGTRCPRRVLYFPGYAWYGGGFRCAKGSE